jgi:hypothetical protein
MSGEAVLGGAGAAARSAALADLIERRLVAMTPAEQQQFEKLLNVSEKPQR